MDMQDDDMLPDERALLEGKTISTETPPAQDEPPAQAAAAAADEPPAAAPAPAAEPPAASNEPPAKLEEGEGSGDADATPAQAAPAPTYEVPAVDFAAEKAKLNEQRTDIDKRWHDGHLSDEERQAELDKLQTARDDLIRQEAKADTIAELNRQATLREQRSVLSTIAKASKDAGLIDYSDPKNANAFDGLRKVFAEAEGLSFAEAAQKAHEALCAARGLKAPTPPAPPAPQTNAPAAPAAPPKPQIPQTLHGLPVAAAAPVGNDFLTSLAASGDPDADEAALESMPRAQREAMFRSTVPTAGARR